MGKREEKMMSKKVPEVSLMRVNTSYSSTTNVSNWDKNYFWVVLARSNKNIGQQQRKKEHRCNGFFGASQLCPLDTPTCRGNEQHEDEPINWLMGP